MAKARRTRQELQQMILEAAKRFDECAGVTGVSISAAARPGEPWEVTGVVRGETSVSRECWARVRSIQLELRQQYDLAD